MSDTYQLIAQAIRFIEINALAQPSLDRVAEHVGLSPYHFQRLFQRWAGVSPKRFLQFLTASHAKQLLRDSLPALEASFAVGLSSPGRLHDLLIATEAVTPGEFKSGGAGLTIRYGFHQTPFGRCLIGVTERGICLFEFVDAADQAQLLERLCHAWPEAALCEDPLATGAVVEKIFARREAAGSRELKLLLRGTNFQLKVWQALLRIPEGRVVSYGYLAAQLNCPGASRAVGSAVGQNPIGYLIPCHRVLRQSGELGGYRWGTERKQALLGMEWLDTKAG
ncbi:MAG TPA: methylated-DNA--[protein]-cysteine S-methyltransferase [Geothermobacteraceae bacterium]|nr:methylated-DNA--[protein]-cysteine S-methyltransferase [Geothermobacteraceae bacterium]